MNSKEIEIETLWPAFEETLLGWWTDDLRTAQEDDLRADSSGTLLYLPFPYSSAGGSEDAFPEMYGWDTYFVNLAMLAYGKLDVVKNHIRNQLFMIERYGFVLNGNRSFYQGRSQPPLHADFILRYIEQTGDRELAMRAYPLLKREMDGYWRAPHHLTESGLHTNRDIFEHRKPTEREIAQLPLIADLSPAMLAEAETGLDFCPNFDGDARDFNPLITNCVLARYLLVLSELAAMLGLSDDCVHWQNLERSLGAQIRGRCWDDERGFFFEYNFKQSRRQQFYTLCGYLPLWAGIATEDEARSCVDQLPRFKHDYGLSQSDVALPSPHAPFSHVQWNYPAGWPPFHVLVPQALRNYGYEVDAKACERAWLTGCLKQFAATGAVYEKYNVVEGSLSLPKERQDTIPPLHGWSTASCLLAGRNLFGRRVL